MRLLAFALAFTAAGAAAQSSGERVQFGEIFGTLYRPAQTGRLPAMVIVHGSAGVEAVRQGFWARELVEFGMVALVTDSFTPRGVDSTVFDQSRVTTTQMLRDAFAALAFLASQDFVDEQRIAIMGMSKGGAIALLAADRQLQRDGRSFSAHLPLYPSCTVQYRNPQPTAPVLMLIGAEDNYTGVKVCAAYAQRMRGAGGRVELKTYRGAHHGFDGDTMNPREFFIAGAENYRDCVVLIEDDGKPGQLDRSCIRRGATVAANHRAKMQALEDAKAFLKTTLFH